MQPIGFSKLFFPHIIRKGLFTDCVPGCVDKANFMQIENVRVDVAIQPERTDDIIVYYLLFYKLGDHTVVLISLN